MLCRTTITSCETYSGPKRRLVSLQIVSLLGILSPRGNADSEETIGAAAITLHGRSRQQRYTKNADWKYISECAALIRNYNQTGNDLSDTVREADERLQPGSKVYFLGNGDCYSHVDYNTHLEEAKVDSIMIARGALIKPVCTISEKFSYTRPFFRLYPIFSEGNGFNAVPSCLIAQTLPWRSDTDSKNIVVDI